jgi:endonuclease/exonuclease/phosphatase family metal-dependent hydrolase
VPIRVAALLAVLLAVSGACARTPHITADHPTLSCREVVPPTTDAMIWITSPRARDHEPLSHWCESVGPIAFEPTPGLAVDGALDRIAVISWNTHVGSGDLTAVVDRVRRGDFTNGERFDAVVLLLQEMYRHGDGVPEHPTRLSVIPSRITGALHGAHEHDVRRVAHERRMSLLYAPSMRNGLLADDPEDRGNAILSTLPLSGPAIVELPFEHQRRVVPVATISGRTSRGVAWRLRLADVHLDTALALTRGGPMTARRRQVDALIDALSNGLRFDGPTIVAGDFNTWLGDREPAIRALRVAFPDAPRLHDGPTWVGPLGIHATLDHMFARGALRAIRVQRLPDRFGSDHFPLLGVVSF